MLVLNDVTSDTEVQGILQNCTNGATGLNRINTACRRLLRRGDWAGTVVPIQVCVFKGCVVWPRYVGTIRKLNVCKKPVPVRNMWYEYLESKGCWGRNGFDWNPGWRSFPNVGTEAMMVGQDRACSFDTIWGDGRLLRFFPRLNADIGKRVTIYGTDNNGQPLQQNISTDPTVDEWVPGNTLILASPFVSTTGFVRSVDRIYFNDVTQGIVDAYAYNAALNQLEPFGHYDPGDQEPSYARYRLNMGCFNVCQIGTTPSCGQPISVMALVKLKFIPAVNPDDLIIPDNLDALKLELQALNFENAGDLANKRAYEAEAVHELNRDLENEFPDDQVTMDVQPFSGVTFGQQCF